MPYTHYSYQALCSPISSRMAMAGHGNVHPHHHHQQSLPPPPPPHPGAPGSIDPETQPQHHSPNHAHFQSDFDSMWKYPFAFHPAIMQPHPSGHRSFAGVELAHLHPMNHSPLTPMKYITTHRNFNPHHHQHTQSYLIDSILNQGWFLNNNFSLFSLLIPSFLLFF